MCRAVHNATFVIIGHNPSAGLQAFGNEPGVKVTGTMPDTRPYLKRSAVGVVPIYAGGGTRLKILR